VKIHEWIIALLGGVLLILLIWDWMNPIPQSKRYLCEVDYLTNLKRIEVPHDFCRMSAEADYVHGLIWADIRRRFDSLETVVRRRFDSLETVVSQLQKRIEMNNSEHNLPQPTIVHPYDRLNSLP